MKAPLWGVKKSGTRPGRCDSAALLLGRTAARVLRIQFVVYSTEHSPELKARDQDVIYLDNNSTTRTDDAVIAAMQPYWQNEYGNPSSLHLLGQSARHAVERAREQVAAFVGARPRDIVFTSGGTEADNLAILGAIDANTARRRIVTTGVEHVAVFSLCEALAKRGHPVTFVSVDSDGRLDLEKFADALTPDTSVAAVMHANNETGVLFPIEDCARIAADKGVPLHVDAVQSAGKVPVNVGSWPVTTLAISAHKFHGPKGAGALYVSPRAKLRNQLVGGHQERDLRPGTENTPAIIGMGLAAELAMQSAIEGWDSVATLRDGFEREICRRVNFARVIGGAQPRIANTTNIAFVGLEAEAILIGLSQRGVCASSGSACSSGSLEPSHVLRAMGLDPDIAKGAIRFSLSKLTTEEEIDEALEIVTQVVTRLKGMSD